MVVGEGEGEKEKGVEWGRGRWGGEREEEEEGERGHRGHTEGD